MIGLNVTKPILVSTSTEGSLWNIPLPTTVKNISACSGATKVASMFVFNLLSPYNPKTGVGSQFRALITSAIIREFDTGFTKTVIADELESLQNRIIGMQAVCQQNLPDNELLAKVEIISLVVVDTDVKLVARLTTKAGTFAYFEV